MIDVVCAVAAATAVQTPMVINGADAQLAPASAPTRFGIRDSLARVLRDLFARRKFHSRKTALPVNQRFPDGKSVREFHKEFGSLESS